MTDRVSRETRSRTMASIRGRDTGPELAVRRALHARGYRFRVCCAGLPGKPDICFHARRHAVFVHGCFWHRCPIHTHKKGVASNVEFWEDKFRKNVARDARTKAALEAMGWTVHVIWECEVKDKARLKRLASALGPPRLRRG
jgi:DNA mismatch endonuclease, patch repair protein